MTQNNAFISYSRKADAYQTESGTTVSFVRDVLCPLCREHGYEPWFDAERIMGGEDYVLRITRQVQESNLFLLVMSPQAAESDWVRAEVHVAFQNPTKVVPLMYKECDPLWFHIFLSRIQYLDIRNDLSALKKYLSAPAPTEHGEAAEPEDDRNRSALLERLAGVAMTLLPWHELNHLRNLAQKRTAAYRGNKPVRGELRHLCQIGLLKRRPERTIGQLGNGTMLDLAEIVELTAAGQELMKFAR
jgi:hypothetical protein